MFIFLALIVQRAPPWLSWSAIIGLEAWLAAALFDLTHHQTLVLAALLGVTFGLLGSTKVRLLRSLPKAQIGDVEIIAYPNNAWFLLWLLGDAHPRTLRDLRQLRAEGFICFSPSRKTMFCAAQPIFKDLTHSEIGEMLRGASSNPP